MNSVAEKSFVNRAPIERDEPLKLELQHFLDAIRFHRDPLVSGEAAKQALEVAMEITEQVRRQ